MLGWLLGYVTISPWYRHREVSPVTLFAIDEEGTKSNNESNGDEKMVNVELG
jgi:hypothetical protein